MVTLVVAKRCHMWKVTTRISWAHITRPGPFRSALREGWGLVYHTKGTSSVVYKSVLLPNERLWGSDTSSAQETCFLSPAGEDSQQHLITDLDDATDAVQGDHELPTDSTTDVSHPHLSSQGDVYEYKLMSYTRRYIYKGYTHTGQYIYIYMYIFIYWK